MTDLIKGFIEENIKLIEKNNWEKIYEKAKNHLKGRTGFFTEIILQADIHPEDYLSELPDHFLSMSSCEEFEIPNNIKRIGSYAFSVCSNLRSIVIPYNVSTIDDYAFRWCIRLTTITIKNPEITFGHNIFMYCDLKDLDIQFAGTKTQWKNIAKGKFSKVTYTCTCIDGIVKKSR